MASTLAFKPLSDPFLAAALWIGLAAFGLTLALSASIVALRLQQGRRERRWRTFVASWRPALLEVMLAGAAAPLPPLLPGDHVLFLRLWAYLHESVRGVAGESLNKVAHAVDVDRTMRRLLVTGCRSDKLLAVLAAGFLRDEKSWAPLRKICDGPDSLLSVNAARSLVRIDALRAAEQLPDLLVRRTDWDLARVGGFLAEAQGPFWLALARSIPRLQPHELRRALQLAPVLRASLPVATLARLLHPSQPADVVAAALPLIEAPELASLVRSCLGHPDPRVREQAALAMARLAEPADLSALEQLLADANRPVRMAAARTLCSLAFLSPEALDGLERQHPEAAPMLRQARAEGAA